MSVLSTLLWGGMIFLVLSVLLSSQILGGGYARWNMDEQAAEVYQQRKKVRMRWALRCVLVALILFTAALLVYNL
ncbi:hypothetical protein [Paenibacillus bovis]|uniref:HIG1 domain-containing protein n=1 Tax=Paenibacillus bovis TaxID=1616788 RepID=A0A172ZEX5_9BACL|nr:hypothetical protein [Paenibacillus bovis]ANF95837.1 hypothetical protein AR543_07340 [Paenibacillus bovis]